MEYDRAESADTVLARTANPHRAECAAAGREEQDTDLAALYAWLRCVVLAGLYRLWGPGGCDAKQAF